jgi:peptide/nickel transport system permease protein
MITPPSDLPSVGVVPEAPPAGAGEFTPEELGFAPTAKPRSMFRRAWEVFAENKLALVSLGALVFMVGFCFIGPLIYHTDQVHVSLAESLCPPSASHPLGCDQLGYDQLGRLMVGGQTSLEVGFAAAIVAVLFGTVYGAFSGFVGGPIDSFLMRVVDAGLSIPYIMVLIILSVIFRPSTTVMIFIIAVFYWFGVARLIRGETLTLRTREYVQAVKVIGQGTFAVADSILILAGLGFLGLGVSPPATDWGSMLSNGLNYLQSQQNYWWLIYPAGIAIIITCISINFIGDALRDAFETRLQRR